MVIFNSYVKLPEGTHLHIIFISSSNHISSPMASRASCSPGSRATKRCSATGMGDPSSHSHAIAAIAAIATRQPPPTSKTQTQQVNDTGPLHQQHHPDRHSWPIVHYGVAGVASLFIIWNQWNHTIFNLIICGKYMPHPRLTSWCQNSRKTHSQSSHQGPLRAG